MLLALVSNIMKQWDTNKWKSFSYTTFVILNLNVRIFLTGTLFQNYLISKHFVRT